MRAQVSAGIPDLKKEKDKIKTTLHFFTLIESSNDPNKMQITELVAITTVSWQLLSKLSSQNNEYESELVKYFIYEISSYTASSLIRYSI